MSENAGKQISPNFVPGMNNNDLINVQIIIIKPSSLLS